MQQELKYLKAKKKNTNSLELKSEKKTNSINLLCLIFFFLS